MWSILYVLSVALVGGALIQRWRLQAWKDVVASCGLEVVKVSSSRLLRQLQLEARAGPATVRIENTSGNTGYTLRLAHNARQDPAAGVRLRNLLALIRELPGDARTLEALRTACEDPSPKIRLRAARELGAERRDVLFELAESLEDDAVSAEAVSTLGRELSFERTQAILDHSLAGRLLKTSRACLEALGKSEDAAAVEPFLIRALQREEADLRVAAANALGRVGSAAAVLPLQEATEGPWHDRELHQAARQAIAEIQSRLQGAAPGQLSLGATDAGQLSLAPAEAGQLSLTQAEVPLLPHAVDEPEKPSHSAREAPGVWPV